MIREDAKPGDLLFYKVTPQSNWIARLIAIAQIWRKEGDGSTQYSHVSIITHRLTQIEAVWPKVKESDVDWSSERLELWRINNISYLQAADIVLHAVQRIGQWYDLGNFFFGLFPSKQRQICTTLVTEAAKDVNITLARDAGDLITPNELIADRQLIRVG